MLYAKTKLYPFFAPQVELAFPAVIQRMRVPAFDLGTLIQPVVEGAPEVPQALRDHLSAINTHILEASRAAPALSRRAPGPQRLVCRRQ